ncbi:MAG: ribosome maturation factor RimP [Gammaproteobacteria bacterium]|nr:ribosome maturation factor RimP [Gammaproteobacteria bacterium]
MKINHEQIEKLVTPVVEAMGYTIWHMAIHQAKRNALLRIYVDLPSGDERKSVSVDDCGLISKQVGALLEVEEAILGSYVLEVSSPGLNRSLYKLEHYQRYVGSKIRMVLRQPRDGQHDFTGTIQEAFDNTLKLLVGDQVIVFELTDISKAKLILDF